MENIMTWIQQTDHHVALFAPAVFILFHIIRPFLFIPVAFICIMGGLFFGITYGAIYSMIGITLSSIMFYLMMQKMPVVCDRMKHLKEKMFGQHRQLSVPQVVLLRITPFIHFHLISLLIIEMTRNFKEYTKLSILSNIPLAIIYTTFGQWIQSLQWQYILTILITILLLFYLLRKKEIVLKWDDFFATNAER
ncbi:putative membrane protein YdjX (TVP38/TMEM64 family) [Alkalibacillus filiformis]|uniref:TVP38/TMEM64 family membrane protein n=1 Tax=Alkalibacillus filiformis TaxID=200990 RepID=A0ABU0DRZ1_9BACI|nr:VTT domain-containing protein [Alkalibacillus filiformis]MDQ0351212.1 putative membrane protein YdjX (TVP38/TMEM64 family) [Alkalibacillus filiformis]